MNLFRDILESASLSVCISASVQNTSNVVSGTRPTGFASVLLKLCAYILS